MLLLLFGQGAALRMPSMTRRKLVVSGAAAACAPALPVLAGPVVVGADPQAAVFAQRFSMAGTITGLPPIFQYSRYVDQLSTPKGSKALSLTMHFDFPQQLAQIGRALGGIQFVDGNSGLKVYVLKASLPGTSLEETPKKWFASSVFSPEGQIAREGVEIDAYKVTKSETVAAPEGAVSARRRLALKYTVITPANQRATDRFAFLDVYEVEGVAYMLLASAGSTKWEGGEKERCQRLADSFYIATTA
jgi:hypothetical protein